MIPRLGAHFTLLQTFVANMGCLLRVFVVFQLLESCRFRLSKESNAVSHLLMVLGLPNTGKSSLINAFRQVSYKPGMHSPHHIASTSVLYYRPLGTVSLQQLYILSLFCTARAVVMLDVHHGGFAVRSNPSSQFRTGSKSKTGPNPGVTRQVSSFKARFPCPFILL